MRNLTNTLGQLPFAGLDDENFQLTLFEHQNGNINFDPERLASLKFNPLLSTAHKNFSLCKDIDPDLNFYSQFEDCEYYTEKTFKNLLTESKGRANGKNLALLHLNIRSISNKLDKFSVFPGNITINFSIIAITETWLKDSSHTVDIPGFNFIHKHREDKVV